MRERASRERALACDAVRLCFRLKPEKQFADLARVWFHFEQLQRNRVREHESSGRTPVGSVFVAGDGAGIGGGLAAERARARAAWAAIEDPGGAVATEEVMRLDRSMARLKRFPYVLDRAFP